MAIAYHIVFCVYGFWLPNDPRGSWSDFVGSWEIFRFGGATKTNARRSVAGVTHDQQLRQEQKRALKYPAVWLSRQQVLAVGHGFERAQEESGYEVYACSILPEHVHLVLGKHASRSVGRVVGHFKARATQELVAKELWPHNKRPVWAEGHWKVFLDTFEDVMRAVSYVDANPEKEDAPRQEWPFVTHES